MYVFDYLNALHPIVQSFIETMWPWVLKSGPWWAAINS